MPVSYTDFLATQKSVEPMSDWPEALKALWYDAKGDWESAHNIAQEMHTDLGSWIHAYLHRKEGDEWNAGYWYRTAKRPFSVLSLEEEHREIVSYALTH